MGKKQGKANRSTSHHNGDVIVSEVSNNWLSSLVNRAIIVGAVVILCGLFAWLYALRVPGDIKQAKPLPVGMDTHYDTTNVENLPLLLRHDYDLSVKDAKQANYGDKVRGFEDAKNVALALNRLGDSPAALRAYDFAANKAPKMEKYEIMIQQMYIADAMGNTSKTTDYYEALSRFIDSHWQGDGAKEMMAELKSAYLDTKAGSEVKND